MSWAGFWFGVVCGGVLFFFLVLLVGTWAEMLCRKEPSEEPAAREVKHRVAADDGFQDSLSRVHGQYSFLRKPQ